MLVQGETLTDQLKMSAETKRNLTLKELHWVGFLNLIFFEPSAISNLHVLRKEKSGFPKACIFEVYYEIY